MGRTCFLHIGLRKTGSSAIQAALHGHDDGRTRYCGFATPNHSAPMTLLFGAARRAPSLRRKGLDEATLKRRRRHARKALQREFASPTNLVISGEGMSTNLGPRQVKRLAARLRREYDAVKAVVYVRPVVSWANSDFQQRVKSEGLAAFEPSPPPYRRRLRPWIRHLGRDNVDIALYDRAGLRNGDVVDDFRARIGLAAAGAATVTRNESLSAEALAFLFCHNRINGRPTGARRHEQARRLLVQRLTGLGEARFSFSPAALAAAQDDDHAASVAWMERITGFSLRDAPPEAATTFDDAAALLDYAGRHAHLLAPLVPPETAAGSTPTGPERCAALMKALEEACYAQLAEPSPAAPPQ